MNDGSNAKGRQGMPELSQGRKQSERR